MRIRILSSALNDLVEGRLFYEKQGEEIGDYFLDSLFSDIDSLALHGGVHARFSDSTGCFRNAFPTRFITDWNRMDWLWSGGFLIADVNLEKFKMR